MSVLIIANPVAGGGRGRAMAEALHRELVGRGIDSELYVTTKKGDATEAARQATCEYVVAVGGDGSANEVANGLAGRDIAMAIQPLGTANVLARELGCPSDPVRVAHMIARGNVRTIDRGLLGDRCFIMGAGAGFDAAVAADVDAQRGKTLGYLGWVAPIVSNLTNYTFPRFRVELDGEVICEEGQYLVASNCKYSAGFFALTPEAQVDDGLFDVCVFTDLTPAKLAILAAASMAPGFAKRQDIVYRQGREVALTPLEDVAVPVQADGDPAGVLPATFRIEPGALRVVVPDE